MTKLKEMIARAKEQIRSAQQMHQLQAQVADIAHKVELNSARRGDNLHLLRCVFGNVHQENFVRMLGIGSQSRYSAIENGKSPLDDNEARKVESELNLSLGWLDRNNNDGLFLSNDEWLLIRALRESRPEAAASLVDMVNNVRASRSEHA